MTQSKKLENVTIKKKKGYTNVQNWAPDDMTLSDKALGLYTRIQRWITFEAEGFVCSKAFIRTKSPSGEKAFDSAWNELKERGYLKMYCVGKSNWTAELLDEPQPDTPHTYYLNTAGEITATNEDISAKLAERKAKHDKGKSNNKGSAKKADNKEVSHGQSEDNLRVPHFRVPLERVPLERDTLKGGNNINTPVNYSFNNYSMLTTQSINHSNTVNEDSAVAKEKKNDRLIDSELIEETKKQIEYERMSQSYTLFGGDNVEPEDLDAAVEIIAELKATNKPQKFGDSMYDAEYIRKRGDSITAEHVRYVFKRFKERGEGISNIRSYLKASFFNAPVTYNSAINNELSAERGIVFN